MSLSLVIRDSDVIPGSTPQSNITYRDRFAARAVVLNDEGEVLLLHVSLHKYHKLPGGGIEADEDARDALQRELLEEIGCTGKIIAELGQVTEYRDQFKLHQISYCFLVSKIGEQQTPMLEPDEKAQGFVETKAKNLKDAIALMKKDNPDNYEGKFITRRDVAILKAAYKNRPQ